MICWFDEVQGRQGVGEDWKYTCQNVNSSYFWLVQLQLLYSYIFPIFYMTIYCFYNQKIANTKLYTYTG